MPSSKDSHCLLNKVDQKTCSSDVFRSVCKEYQAEGAANLISGPPGICDVAIKLELLQSPMQNVKRYDTKFTSLLFM